MIHYFPRTAHELDSLKKLDEETLQHLGLGCWTRGEGFTDMVVPEGMVLRHPGRLHGYGYLWGGGGIRAR